MNDQQHNQQYQWTMLEGMDLHSYHHTFENISDGLCRHGFVIERILEARADDGLKKEYAQFYARTNMFPSFCGFRTRKV